MVGPDIAGDWVTVGIIASTLSTLKSNSRNKRNEGKKPQETQFGVYQFFDLKDTSVNLLLSQECVTMMAKEEMGSVVALLNPTIMTPNEVLQMIFIFKTCFTVVFSRVSLVLISNYSCFY